MTLSSGIRVVFYKNIIFVLSWLCFFGLVIFTPMKSGIGGGGGLCSWIGLIWLRIGTGSGRLL
jgi:hypothetical protein